MLRSLVNRLTAGGGAAAGRRGAGRRAAPRGHGRPARRSTGGSGAQIGAMVERFVRGRR
jgi:hypothetical protein